MGILSIYLMGVNLVVSILQDLLQQIQSSPLYRLALEGIFGNKETEIRSVFLYIINKLLTNQKTKCSIVSIEMILYY